MANGFETRTYDFRLDNHGSICILYAESVNGRDWAVEYLPEDSQRWAGGYVIEPRYVENIVNGILDSGLSLRTR